MPSGEIYIKLVVGFPRDPKVRALARYGSPDAGLARDLYVQMCLYCKDQLSDGFVPSEEVGALAYPLDMEHSNQLAKQLASVGLIKEVSNPEAPESNGWLVCAFLKRNRSRDDVEKLSEVRAEAGRTGGLKGRKRPAQRGSRGTSKQVANQPGDQDAEQTGSIPVSVSVSVVPDGTTDTETPTSEGSKEPSDNAGSSRSKRGTRIPADFATAGVTAEMVTWARERCPHVDGKHETEKFVNHFTAKSGQAACKLDWPATWRNWMLTAEERAPQGRASPNGSAPPLPAAISSRDEHRYRR